jgi:hypothetical protein
VREVELGPFKIKMDDSLPVRRAALGVLEALFASPLPFPWAPSSQALLRCLLEAATVDPYPEASELLPSAHAAIVKGVAGGGAKPLKALIKGDTGALDALLGTLELVLLKYVRAHKRFTESTELARNNPNVPMPDSAKVDAAKEGARGAYRLLRVLRESFEVGAWAACPAQARVNKLTTDEPILDAILSSM